MKPPVKKVLKIVGIVLLALLGLIIMIGLIAGNKQQASSPVEAESSALTELSDEPVDDPKLEQLKKRRDELDKVYDGDRQTASPDNEDFDDPFQSVGEFSDFDESHQEPSATEEDPSEVQMPTEDATADTDVQPAAPGDSASLEPSPADVSLVEIEQLKTEVSRLKSSVASMESSNPSKGESPAVSKEDIRELKDQAQRFENFIELQNGKPDDATILKRLEALESKVEKLSAKQTTSNRPKSSARQQQPSVNVEILYTLQRIVGDTAVLKGNNTGRVYHYRVGDPIAYGGRLSSIRGDAITLHWPHRDVTLSVF